MPDRHVRPGSRVTTGFRLRSLSERGRLDRGHCDHRWMLKRVPDWGGEWEQWPGSPLCSCNRLPEASCALGNPGFFLWEAHPAPMNSAPIAAWRPLIRDNSGNVAMPATGQEHQAKTGPHQPLPPETGTRFSIPNRPVPAQSRRPRSDNHRSRNHVVTGKARRT